MHDQLIYQRRQAAPSHWASVLMRAWVVWVVIMLLESVHGTLRELFLKPLVGDLRARQISFFTALVIIFSATLISIRWIRAASSKQLLLVGLMWAALTFAFEAFIARLAFNVSWERFFSDYDISEGGMMAIGLIILTFVPFVAARMRRNTVE